MLKVNSTKGMIFALTFVALFGMLIFSAQAQALSPAVIFGSDTTADGSSLGVPNNVTIDAQFVDTNQSPVDFIIFIKNSSGSFYNYYDFGSSSSGAVNVNLPADDYMFWASAFTDSYNVVTSQPRHIHIAENSSITSEAGSVPVVPEFGITMGLITILSAVAAFMIIRKR